MRTIAAPQPPNQGSNSQTQQEIEEEIKTSRQRKGEGVDILGDRHGANQTWYEYRNKKGDISMSEQRCAESSQSAENGGNEGVGSQVAGHVLAFPERGNESRNLQRLW